MQLVTVRSPEPVGGKKTAPTGKGTPTDDHSRRPETLQGRQWKGGPRGRCCHDAARRVPSCPVARAPCDVSIMLEVKPTHQEANDFLSSLLLATDGEGVLQGDGPVDEEGSHPGRGLRGGGPRHRARPSYLHLGHDARGARHLEGRRL
jgi:hypothetical protein